MNKRCIMRIEVLPGVPGSLSEVTDLFGSTQVFIVSRLLEWFAVQPDVTQAQFLACILRISKGSWRGWLSNICGQKATDQECVLCNDELKTARPRALPRDKRSSD
jgi:hypothetical protein